MQELSCLKEQASDYNFWHTLKMSFEVLIVNLNMPFCLFKYVLVMALTNSNQNHNCNLIYHIQMKETKCIGTKPAALWTRSFNRQIPNIAHISQQLKKDKSKKKRNRQQCPSFVHLIFQGSLTTHMTILWCDACKTEF